MKAAYTPTAGSKTDRALGYVEQYAPAGGGKWLSAADIALGVSGVKAASVAGLLTTPERHGLVVRAFDAKRGTLYQAASKEDILMNPSQRTVPAAEAPRPETTAPNSVFALGAACVRPDDNSDDEGGIDVSPARPHTAAAAAPKPPVVVTTVTAGGVLHERAQRAGASIAVEKPEVESVRQLAQKVDRAAAEQGADDFACALFSDGRLLLEFGEDFVQLSPKRTKVLLDYLDRLRDPEAVA